MGRSRKQKKRSSKEKLAFAMLMGGDYIPYANLIQVTKEATPTVWYCATRLTELPDNRARERLRHCAGKNRRGIGGYKPGR